VHIPLSPQSSGLLSARLHSLVDIEFILCGKSQLLGGKRMFAGPRFPSRQATSSVLPANLEKAMQEGTSVSGFGRS